jgi:uncharacterized protein (TIGR02246 family)
MVFVGETDITLCRIVFIGVMALAPIAAHAGPADEANAAVELWSAAYSGNDPEVIAGLYTSDAILLGTVSPVMSEGTAAIVKYFTPIKGSGNTNKLVERRNIVLNDNAVVVTGFYEFTRMQQGKPVAGPSRFTMLLVKRDGQWLIAHHHSSPHVQPTPTQ